MARLILAAGLALTIFDGWLAHRFGSYGTLFDLKEIAQIAAWLAAGYFAGRIRPGTPMRVLMMTLGLLLASTAPAAFALETGSAGLQVVVTVAYVLTALQLPLGAHVFLAYPSGHVRDRSGRTVMVGGYAFGAVMVVLQALAGPVRPSGDCRDVCTPLPLVDSPALAGLTSQLAGLGSAVLTLVGASVIVRRMITASRRQRRVLAFPAVAMVLTALLFALVGVFAATGTNDLNPTLALAQFASLVAVPAAFFLGLVRERLDEARVSDLIRRIQYMPAGRLSDAVSQALGDPSVRIRAEVPDDIPADHLTVVGDRGDPLGVIVHDPSLRAEPQLLEAVSAAVGLALENARLQAAVRAQLAQVRASRARLVTAGDEARRKLERDLHDGAQQRMLSVGLILSLLRHSLTDAGTETKELLDEAEAELRLATQELRELARGIHPAVLTIQGLKAAVEQLVVRVPVRARVRIDELPELSDATKATAYFVVSEALANTVRHAKASEIDIRITYADGQIRVRVEDDGKGGADFAAGSGLTGLADRVAAIDGVLRLDSPLGVGTVVEVELPCG
ncbi:histidine kinase [Kibdelosporangium persicum]|uniref:histidine kinase n=1 Tax=Kibdelosporangium persicum TaxID=2698649 RepID=A0ABX2F378_9PSEU|nr:histidine kinase [Kibdelosporangium persicum]NRN65295.1 Signal transduction histidine kinase [Kibdelosporangium persicum]